MYTEILDVWNTNHILREISAPSSYRSTRPFPIRTLRKKYTLSPKLRVHWTAHPLQTPCFGRRYNASACWDRRSPRPTSLSHSSSPISAQGDMVLHLGMVRWLLLRLENALCLWLSLAYVWDVLMTFMAATVLTIWDWWWVIQLRLLSHEYLV